MKDGGQKHVYRGATDVYISPYLTSACPFGSALRVKHDFAHMTSVTPLFFKELTLFIACMLKLKPFQ